MAEPAAPTPLLAALSHAVTQLGALSITLRAAIFHKAATELPEDLQKKSLIDGVFVLKTQSGEIIVHREASIVG